MKSLLNKALFAVFPTSGLLYSVFTSQPPGGDSTIGLGRGVVLEASLGLFRICELDYVKGVDT